MYRRDTRSAFELTHLSIESMREDRHGSSGATLSLSTLVLEKMPAAGIIPKLCPMETVETEAVHGT